MYDNDVLDLRQLADEWRSEIEDAEIALDELHDALDTMREIVLDDKPRYPRLAVASAQARIVSPEAEDACEIELGKFSDLASQIGCDDDPDSLESWANNYEPTLIAEDYFEEYARELAEDVGALSNDWPASYIDWEAAAVALQMDYTSVEFDGTTYYYRA